MSLRHRAIIVIGCGLGKNPSYRGLDLVDRVGSGRKKLTRLLCRRSLHRGCERIRAYTMNNECVNVYKSYQYCNKPAHM